MDVVRNIKKIRLDKSINQQVIADALNVDTAVISNIENGKRDLKVRELEIISKCLNVDLLDLFTYPKKYVDSAVIQVQERVSVTFEVSSDKRDLLIQLVTNQNKYDKNI